MEKATMSVQELSMQMGISMPKAYELVKSPGFPVIRVGTRILMRAIGVTNAVIGVEANKPDAVKHLQAIVGAATDIKVQMLKTQYPQGGEKVLVYHTLGRVIKEGGLPLDCGVVVMNCTTIANISKFIRTGMPLVEKCVTVDGSAIKEPKNVIAPIGTPVADVLAFAGGLSQTNCKVLMGGPMTGHALNSLSEPVVKTTNAIVALGGNV